jgi:predicted MFS family arabinose efflux permease
MQRNDAFRTALAGLIAMAAAIGIGRFVYTPIVPAMIEELHLSTSAAGLIASANFLGYLAGGLLAASPSLPGSRHAWLLGSLAASGLTTAGMGFVHGMQPFLLLRFVGGGSSAIVLVLASAIVLEHLAQARRPGLSALHFAGVGCGIAASAVLVAALQAGGQSWAWLWEASGILSLGAAAVVAVLLPQSTTAVGQTTGRTSRPADPALLRLVAAYGLFGFGYVITATFLVVIVRTTPSIRALEPVIWVVFGLAAAPSVAMWAWIATRFGTVATFALACVVEACGVLASIAWPSEMGAFASAILVGGTFMGLTALGLVRARTLAAGDPRRVLALMTSAFGLGQIIGPSFAGMLSDRVGSFAMPSMAAVVALLIAAGLVCVSPETAADSRAVPR